MPVIAPSQSSTNPQSINAISPRDTSAGITGGIVVAILALSMAYAVGLYFLYRYSRDHPKPMNKVESVTLQKYFPRKSISKLCSTFPFVSTIESMLLTYRFLGSALFILHRNQHRRGEFLLQLTTLANAPGRRISEQASTDTDPSIHNFSSLRSLSRST